MNICLINSKILRQLWSEVEQTQTSTLVGLSDPDLVKQLVGQLDSKQALSSEEMNSVNAYLFSRTQLIRDLAFARSA
ncbi:MULTISPECIES: hypothetical protein [Calothrix]|uniref:Uncharacterized protein n=2 Tax=Calothrix TaxID=1186 RepID=A0ABR8A464_9CYAN|nr:MULTISPECIES: hypothetical protein [Calothrix]MBD2194747.1 hypothetical protein [Calothrix parietina FACHB-288]MBD2225103.1 hypothetical protein [Calothrix anomala FACHB-343]BAY61671.1 hypothetical protein NIES22_17380 [Calothrix brevissima NIES-22]